MVKGLFRVLRKLGRDERGVSSTEFGIVIGLVALVSLQALSMLGEEVEQNFDNTGQSVAQMRADPFGQGRGRSTDPNEPTTAGGAMAPGPEQAVEAVEAPYAGLDAPQQPYEP